MQSKGCWCLLFCCANLFKLYAASRLLLCQGLRGHGRAVPCRPRLRGRRPHRLLHARPFAVGSRLGGGYGRLLLRGILFQPSSQAPLWGSCPEQPGEDPLLRQGPAGAGERPGPLYRANATSDDLTAQLRSSCWTAGITTPSSDGQMLPRCLVCAGRVSCSSLLPEVFNKWGVRPDQMPDLLALSTSTRDVRKHSVAAPFAEWATRRTTSRARVTQSGQDLAWAGIGDFLTQVPGIGAKRGAALLEPRPLWGKAR